MANRRFEQAMSPKQHVEQDLVDSGAHDVYKGQDVIDFGVESVEKRKIKVGEIEPKSWQDALDTAFIQGKYDLVNTMNWSDRKAW